MDIKDYVKTFNLTFEEIKNDFTDQFDLIFKEEQEWLCNIENKLNLLKKEKDRRQINIIIQKLKNNDDFTSDDTLDLSAFVSKINPVVKVADRINNFKEGTLLDNGETLKLHHFFNTVRVTNSLNDLEYELNNNLKIFLPHIFSVIKHCQSPNEFPIYYKYWKNIIREVLLKDDDYDSMCSFYRSFPSINRHLNFGTFLGVIGIQIAENIKKNGFLITRNSKDFRYLKNKVINIDRFSSILDNQVLDPNNSESNLQYWLYSPGENARKWDEFYNEGIMAIGWDEIGDLQKYKNRDEIKQALVDAFGGEGSKKNDISANDDFLNKLKIGDIIIVKKGRGELLGYGMVTSDYEYDENRAEYHHIRKVDWKLKGNWKVDFSLVLKTFTDITKYPSSHPDYGTYYEYLLSIMEQTNQNNNQLEETKMKFPLNTILYGPPGTGKTYNTILRAAEIVENRKIDSYKEALAIFKANLHNQIEFITFHQNYSYEDFIQGLRPDTKQETEQLLFKKSDGVFKKIADRALKNYKESEKAPEEISKEKRFVEALETLKEMIMESEEPIKINETAYFTAVEDDAFRYSGDNWTLGEKGFNGFRMKYSDLERFFEEDVKERKEIKNLSNISGLAKQHATYFIKAFGLVKSLIPKFLNNVEEVKKKNYVIIIDEINRANISRVFGELITLIEPDKRSHGAIPLEARLPSGDSFIVPSNLYIIGTMNTADKSIALLDIALRRRFEFESMYPLYEITGEKIYDVDILKKINDKIISSKGHDFQIGHAYFMGENTNLIERMNKKVIPLLLEYYMNDEKDVKGILQSVELKIEDGSWPLRITGKND